MTKRSLLSAALGLLFSAGMVFAQNRPGPRANCPNPGQNCPRNGQCIRQGGNAKGGPAAMGRGMRRGARMNANGCVNAATANQAKPEAGK